MQSAFIAQGLGTKSYRYDWLDNTTARRANGKENSNPRRTAENIENYDDDEDAKVSEASEVAPAESTDAAGADRSEKLTRRWLSKVIQAAEKKELRQRTRLPTLKTKPLCAVECTVWSHFK